MENQFSKERIEGMIVSVRNVHVIIDRDLQNFIKSTYRR